MVLLFFVSAAILNLGQTKFNVKPWRLIVLHVKFEIHGCIGLRECHLNAIQNAMINIKSRR